jgi:hypothetical protein
MILVIVEVPRLAGWDQLTAIHATPHRVFDTTITAGADPMRTHQRISWAAIFREVCDGPSVQERIYGFMVRNEVSAPDYFLIAPQRVVGLGTRVEIRTSSSLLLRRNRSAVQYRVQADHVSPRPDPAEATGKRLALRAESDEPREAHLGWAAIEAANRTIDSLDIWPDHAQAT